MTTQMTNALATLAAAAIFAAIFYSQSWIDWPRKGQRGYRRVISLSAGAAVAYVFVHLLPELATASEKFVQGTAGLDLPFPHHRVYLAALLGFMVFYGLEHMVNWSRLGGGRQGAEHVAHEIHYRILAGSYALYVLVVSYLMAHEMEAGGGRLALFALAMGLHFLGLGHGLRRHCPSLYDGWGRHALAGAAIAGWAVSLLTPLSDSVAHTLLGFVAGAVMMNTATSELPADKEGRFLAFAIGGVAYTAILLLTNH
jgi:hypothetical protein